jgi:hypothetical protein
MKSEFFVGKNNNDSIKFGFKQKNNYSINILHSGNNHRQILGLENKLVGSDSKLLYEKKFI